MTTRAELEQLTGIFLRAFMGNQDAADAIGAAVVSWMIDIEDLSIVSLRHVGWINLDDHSLVEMDTDTDFQPPDTAPVWQVGNTAIGLPELDVLD